MTWWRRREEPREKSNADLIAQGCHPGECDPWCPGPEIVKPVAPIVQFKAAEALELFPCDGTGCRPTGQGGHARDCARATLEWFLRELAKPREERETYHGVPLS